MCTHFCIFAIAIAEKFWVCETHQMDTSFVLEKLAGDRNAMAKMFGVATITTYHWVPTLPPKHLRYLRLLRPDWVAEWTSVSKRRGRAAK